MKHHKQSRLIRESSLRSEIRLNRSLPSKHFELLWEDLSQANDEENLAGELRE
jgi:hypothetical protein